MSLLIGLLLLSALVLLAVLPLISVRSELNRTLAKVNAAANGKAIAGAS